MLQATGALIPIDPIPYQSYDKQVQVYTHSGNYAVGPFYLPLVHPAYRLATAYQGSQRFHLAGGDLYLSSLNHAHLPSRAIRCLKECGDAFRHGLYLSATMTVGAASESLWMELGQLICDKGVIGTTRLSTELNSPMPNIGRVIKPTWDALLTSHGSLLKKVFGHDGERDKFYSYAEQLRDRRNYAMHNKAANIGESWFTYEVTGLLLLYAVEYFNQFAALLDEVNALP